MAEQTAAPEVQDTGTETGGEEQGGGQDALLSHMEAMSSKLDQLIPQAQAPSFQQLTDPSFDPFEGYDQEPEPEYDFQQQGYDPQQPQYEPQQQQGMDPNQALQWLQNEIQQGVQAQIAPMVAQQRAREIETQYPDLAKPETIQQIAPIAVNLAQSMGLPSDGWRNPDFLLMVYQAQQAQTISSQQIAPEDQQFDQQGFERGGAGVPDSGEPNLAERLLAAYPHGSAAEFWGA
jgi:hypothetical protein